MVRTVVPIVTLVLGLHLALIPAEAQDAEGDVAHPAAVDGAGAAAAGSREVPDAASDTESVETLRRDVQALSAALEALSGRLEGLEEQAAAVLAVRHLPELPDTVELAGEPVPLNRWDVKERLEREFFLALGDRGQVVLWLKRSARYFPYIEGELRRAGLPDDLKYVAVIESSLLPHAYSSARALGIWQFIAPTARRYGLRITSWRDDRRDPERATAAAFAYLGDVYARFRDWPLALAAYNAGEDAIERALRRQGVSSYYQLALPEETERYVFRTIAAKLILADPERYGFRVPHEQRYSPPEAAAVEILVRGRLLLRELAEVSGSFYREIKALNPALRRDYLPAGRHVLRLPKPAAEHYATHRRELERALAARALVRYRVRPGDTLSRIAAEFGVSVSALKRWNETARKPFIFPGEVLVIPPHRSNAGGEG